MVPCFSTFVSMFGFAFLLDSNVFFVGMPFTFFLVRGAQKHKKKVVGLSKTDGVQVYLP